MKKTSKTKARNRDSSSSSSSSSSDDDSSTSASTSRKQPPSRSERDVFDFGRRVPFKKKTKRTKVPSPTPKIEVKHDAEVGGDEEEVLTFSDVDEREIRGAHYQDQPSSDEENSFGDDEGGGGGGNFDDDRDSVNEGVDEEEDGGGGHDDELNDPKPADDGEDEGYDSEVLAAEEARLKDAYDSEDDESDERGDSEGEDSDVDRYTEAELLAIKDEEIETDSENEDDVDAQGKKIRKRPNYSSAEVKIFCANETTFKERILSCKLYYIWSRRAISTGSIKDKAQPYWVVTVRRANEYTKYLLNKEVFGSTELRLQSISNAKRYLLHFFKFHWTIGGNPENDKSYSAVFPASALISKAITDHFGKDKIQQRLKEKKVRGQFFPTDLDNAFDNNHPFWPLTFLAFATLCLVLQCGTRDGSTRGVRLFDVVKVRVDSITFLVSVTIRFRHFKGEHECLERLRTFTGYLHKTMGFRLDFVYHLHRC
jgi:hypothetical protein